MTSEVAKAAKNVEVYAVVRRNSNGDMQICSDGHGRAAKKLSEKQLRAIRILDNHLRHHPNTRGMRAPDFGEAMWPDSPTRTRHYNCGTNGSARGLGLSRAAVGFLGKLEKQGFVDRYECEYRIRNGQTRRGAPYYFPTTKALDLLKAEE